jgi:predicted permease
VLFPSLLFGGLVKVRIEWSSAAPMLAVAGAAMGGGMLLGLAARFLPITPISFASQYQCAFRFNSYIGLAVAGTLHGIPGIAAMGIVVGLMVPPANLAAVWMLARHGEAGVLRELLRNPLILATLAGIAANLGGLELPTVALKFLGRLGDAAIVLGLLAVGGGLRIVGAGGSPTLSGGGLFSAGQARGDAGDCLVADTRLRFGRCARRCGADLRRPAGREFGLHPGPAHGWRRRARRLADFGGHAA